MPVMDEPLPAAVEPAEEPLQFSLRAIMIAQAVCALFCGLFVIAGIFALLAAFVVTLVYCFVGVRPENARLKRFIVDLLGGVVLPILCVAYDPILFREPGVGNRWQVWWYLVLLVQMSALLVCLLGHSWFGRWNAVFAGLLLVGAVIALGIGALLLIPSILGAVLAQLIGLLGFTPFLTAFVFARNAWRAFRQARTADGKTCAEWLVLLGVLLAIALPALLYAVAGEWVLVAIKLIPWPAPKPFM
jgi:hypothetical protein